MHSGKTRTRSTSLWRGGSGLAVLALAGCVAAGCSSSEPGSESTTTLSHAADERTFDGRLPPVRRQAVQLAKEPSKAANAQVLVEFDVREPTKEIEFYPYVLGGNAKNPLLLRDDGRGGDEKGGDGVFSGPLLVDTDSLTRRLEREQKEIDLVKDAPRFEGRNIVARAQPRVLDRAVLDHQIVDFFPFDLPIFSQADAEKSLIVRDPSVVRDLTRTYDPCNGVGNGNGAWGFGRLMSQMAAPLGVSTSFFVEQWLRSWLTPRLENSFTAPARVLVQNLIDNWRTASLPGPLDVNRAPFRLLAIVNRTDMGTAAGSIGGYPGGGNIAFDGQGELRFVFGLVIPPGFAFKNYNPFGGARNVNGCLLQPFTVIFEYSNLKDTCQEIKAYNEQWQDLEAMPFGAAYNASLQAITDPITVANAAPGRPNGSALNQLRTNDFAFASPWEMREFHLQAPASLLDHTVVKDNADLVHNNRPWTGNFIENENGAPPSLFFPAAYGAVPPNALASSSIVPSTNTFWNGTGSLNPHPTADPLDSRQRHNFSLAACNGCHARETNTAFVHIDNRTPTLLTPAPLSGFLTGITVRDPIVPFAPPACGASSQVCRTFDDLERRQLRQEQISNFSCSAPPFFDIVAVQDLLVKHLPIPEDPFRGFEQPPLAERVSIPLESFAMDRVAQVH